MSKTWKLRCSYVTRRRASGYIYFLATSVLVLSIGMSALAAMRVERKTNEWGTSTMAARTNALSAIQIGRAMISQDANWRTTYPDGNWFANKTIGTGRMTLRATTIADADANTNNNAVTLEATGYQGEAIQKVKVTLIPATTNGGLVTDSTSWQRGG